MYIGAQSGIVSQVIARVVRVGIEHNVVARPEPVGDVNNVDWRDFEVEPVEPETTRAATLKPPDMVLANFTGEMPILPGMVEVITRIILTRVVAYPLVVCRIDVRRRGMARPVRNGSPLGRLRGRRMGCGRRTVSRNVAASDLGTNIRLAVLRSPGRAVLPAALRPTGLRRLTTVLVLRNSERR